MTAGGTRVLPLLLGKGHQHEIADAWVHDQANLRQFLAQPGEPAVVVLDRAGHVILVVDRGDAGCKRGRGDVERSPDPVDDVDHIGLSVHPAQAQSGQAVDLREGPRGDDIGRHVDQGVAVAVVLPADVLGVGRIDHEQHIVGQAGVEAPHFRVRDVGAGRIVRVGDEDGARARRHRCQQGIDIRRQQALGRGHRHGSCGERGNPVHHEAVRAVEHPSPAPV